MIFNIITPLARFNNYNKLKEALRPFNIKWHIIIDDDKKSVWLNHNGGIETEDWISVYMCPNQGVDFWARCNNSINWFIENNLNENDEYFGILNDDDSYEKNFFEKIKNSLDSAKENDLIIVSMLRGHNIPMDAIPVRRHETGTLLALPQNMRIGSVGVEQFFVKGKLLKRHRLPLELCGDGMLVMKLVNSYTPIYLPNCYVLFNYFEPGRWQVAV